MKVFVYEFLTGGGLLIDPKLQPFAGSLSVEGLAMLRAVVEDFAAIKDVQVTVLKNENAWHHAGDAGCGFDSTHLRAIQIEDRVQAEESIIEQASLADWTLVIAPEIDGHLLQIVRSLEKSGANLLSPNSDFVDIAADKLRLSELLMEKGCPTIETWAFESNSFDRNLGDHDALVAKPRFGAGSTDMRIVDGKGLLEAIAINEQYVIQPLMRGTAVSVSAICQNKGVTTLPPSYQHVSDHTPDDPFAYHGGSLPVKHELLDRADKLARQALRSMPPTIGFCGVDLLLGDEPDGSEDVVVEINPRLTTSYVGLRATCRDNLAAAMIAAATGEHSDLQFKDEHVVFDCSGNVTIAQRRS